VEAIGVALVVLGCFLAFGPYQDDRTWNLIRDSCQSDEIEIPGVTTHFKLRQLIPLSRYERYKQDAKGYMRDASPILFLHGNMGKWTQIININAQLNVLRPYATFSADFHNSASALHPSLVEVQADFAAAAIDRITQLYAELGRPGVQLTVVGHSMGGVVAQRALQLLAERNSDSVAQVRALVLLCTPILGHPLLLEPRQALITSQLSRGFWGSGRALPWTVAIAAGETDALVPSEIASLPRMSNGVSIVTSSMRDVHASFSHVNVLFSRHSVKAFADIIARACDGDLPKAALSLPSPLSSLFSRSTHLGALLPVQDKRAGVPWRLGRIGANGAVSFSDFAIDELFHAAPQSVPMGGFAQWDLMEEGALHLVPFPHSASCFSLVLLEEPRHISRAPERTSRGEDFNEKDKINCTMHASVQIVVFARSGVAEWHEVPVVPVQYPVKACVFHLRAPVLATPDSVAVVAMKRRLVRRQRTLSVSAWAQWHDDTMAEPSVARRTAKASFSLDVQFPMLAWLSLLFRPAVMTLPAGRAVVSRIVAPMGQLSSFLPIDVYVASGRSTEWGLRALCVAAEGDGSVVRVDALREGLLDSGPARPVPWGWAAESDPHIFSPRFSPLPFVVEGSDPSFLVLADPTSEFVLHLRANLWSALARCFRTYLGLFFASWFGATIALYASSISSGGVWRHLLVWAMLSSSLVVLTPELFLADGDFAYSPGSPPPAVVFVIHLFGASCAAWSRHVGNFLASFFSCLCRCRSPHGVSQRNLAWMWVELAFWFLFAAVHPSISLVFMNVRLLGLRAFLRRRDIVSNKASVAVEAGDMKTISDTDRRESETWLAGFVAMLALYIICYLPSIILTIWVLQGQHREASDARYNKELIASLPTSRHAPPLWVDSWFFEGRTELRDAIEIPAMGLILPALALVHHAGVSSARRGPLIQAPCRVFAVARGLLFVISFCAVWFVGNRPDRVWLAFQPVFAAHAFVQMVAAWYQPLACATGSKEE